MTVNMRMVFFSSKMTLLLIFISLFHFSIACDSSPDLDDASPYFSPMLPELQGYWRVLSLEKEEETYEVRGARGWFFENEDLIILNQKVTYEQEGIGGDPCWNAGSLKAAEADEVGVIKITPEMYAGTVGCKSFNPEQSEWKILKAEDTATFMRVDGTKQWYGKRVPMEQLKWENLSEKFESLELTITGDKEVSTIFSEDFSGYQTLCPTLSGESSGQGLQLLMAAKVQGMVDGVAQKWEVSISLASGSDLSSDNQLVQQVLLQNESSENGLGQYLCLGAQCQAACELEVKAYDVESLTLGFSLTCDLDAYRYNDDSDHQFGSKMTLSNWNAFCSYRPELL